MASGLPDSSSPLGKGASRSQRILGLLLSLQEEIEALQMENRSLQERLALVEGGGRESQSVGGAAGSTGAHTASLLGVPERGEGYASSEGGGKTKKSVSQRVQAAYQASTNKIVATMFHHTPMEAQLHRRFFGHTDGLWDISTCQHNTAVVGTASADCSARIWDVTNGSCLAIYREHKGSVNSLRFHPTQPVACTAAGDGSVCVWPMSFETPSGLRWSESEDRGASTPMGTLATASNTAAEGPGTSPEAAYPVPTSLTTTLLRLQAHSGPVAAVDWVHGGEWLVSGGYDRAVRLWDSNLGVSVQTHIAHEAEVTNVTCDPLQKLIVSSSRDCTARLWDVRQPDVEVIKMMGGHTEAVNSAVFMGSMIVTAGDDRCVKLWDLRKVSEAVLGVRTEAPVNRLAVHASKKMIALPMDNGRVKVMDATGARLARIPRGHDEVAHKRMVTGAAWGVEETLYTCAFDRSALSWRLQQHSKERDKDKDRDREREREREREKEKEKKERTAKHNS